MKNNTRISVLTMNKLVLLLAAAALLCDGCHSANINKLFKFLPDIKNNIEANGVPSKHVRKFLAIASRPPALRPHEVGTTVELTCEALGTPAPVIHWYKNDSPVYEFDLESNDVMQTNPTSLGRLSSTLLVTRTDSQDMYTCLVLSGSNTAQATSMVYRVDGGNDLSERVKLSPLVPRILVSYKVFLDTIGNSIVLPCRARGHPKPKVTWSWRNSTDHDMKLNNRMKVLRSGELLISELRWPDMGEYTCRASNLFGAETASTFVYPAKASG